MLSLLYGPTLTSIYDSGKIKDLTMYTFVGKVMSLLSHTLSRFVITFLPRSKCLNFMAAVILEPKKIKSVSLSVVSPCTCHKVMGLNAMIYIF